MDEKIKMKLFEKNEKLINMVIERAKRDFPDDIAIIGLTGSFRTNDFHEKSDLDLIIINNTDRGWGISYCFILDDVGYDIYCTPFETRIEAEANLESPMVSSLVDMKIIYYSNLEYLDKFNSYKERALNLLSKPIGKECIERANTWIDRAKLEYTNALLADDIGSVRYACGKMLYHCINALTSLNNTYIKRGIKRYLEELVTYEYLPDNFAHIYMSVIEAKTRKNMQESAYEMIKSIVSLYDKMKEDYVEHTIPTYDNLTGTYEELWCNYRNKVFASVRAKDKSYAFHTALGAQEYLDEMTDERGTKKFDLMQYFDADNLEGFQEAFLNIMDEYLNEYHKVGRKVARYDTLDELYEHYMAL